MPRLPDFTLDELTPEQRRVHDAILSGPRGRVEGPLRIWLDSPELAERAQRLGAFCRFGTSLEPRLSELAILVTGAFWQAGFEWHVHAPIGIAAGLDAGLVESLRQGGTPAFPREDEAAVFRFSDELLRKRRVSDATYAEALRLLGRTGLVDLVGVLGYYGLISMTIVAFEVPVPQDSPEPFAQR